MSMRDQVLAEIQVIRTSLNMLESSIQRGGFSLGGQLQNTWQLYFLLGQLEQEREQL